MEVGDGTPVEETTAAVHDIFNAIKCRARLKHGYTYQIQNAAWSAPLRLVAMKEGDTGCPAEHAAFPNTIAIPKFGIAIVFRFASVLGDRVGAVSKGALFYKIATGDLGHHPPYRDFPPSSKTDCIRIQQGPHNETPMPLNPSLRKKPCHKNNGKIFGLRARLQKILIENHSRDKRFLAN